MTFYFSSVDFGIDRVLSKLPIDGIGREAYPNVCFLAIVEDPIRVTKYASSARATWQCRPSVLKITQWVLIGSENSLLYLILLTVSRKGILTPFASF